MQSVFLTLMVGGGGCEISVVTVLHMVNERLSLWW